MIEIDPEAAEKREKYSEKYSAHILMRCFSYEKEAVTAIKGVN